VEGTIESLRRSLEEEEQSENLLQLPGDAYSKAATYTQGLRRVASSSSSDLTNRLVQRQLELIEGLVRRLLRVRIRKAVSQGVSHRLLPEERFVSSSATEFKRISDEFVNAVVNGQPSFVANAVQREMGRGVTVRFLKDVAEVIGFDLRRYGPFKSEDLAVIPSANADIFVANGEAMIVYTRER
jgi:DNA replication initiation complex subunit (GINS family)